MTKEILPIESANKAQESLAVWLAMGDVQKKVHSLTNTEWNQIRDENPFLFKLQNLQRRSGGTKMTYCVSSENMNVFKEKLNGLRIRKAQDREKRNSPETLAERERIYRLRNIQGGSRN